jgi:hypothetical protein
MNSPITGGRPNTCSKKSSATSRGVANISEADGQIASCSSWIGSDVEGGCESVGSLDEVGSVVGASLDDGASLEDGASVVVDSPSEHAPSAAPVIARVRIAVRTFDVCDLTGST